MVARRKTPVRRRRAPIRRTTKPKRTQRRSNRTFLSTRGGATITDKLFTTMQYTDNITMTTTAGAPFPYQFQTSCFDPNLTGVGHQPLGFDQWATFYTKYRVHGIKYEFTFINTSTTTQSDAIVLPKDQNTVTTSANTLWERPYTKRKILGVEGSGQAVKTIRGYINPSRVLGFSKLQYNTDDLTHALVGSNPSTMAFLQIYVSPVDQATDITVIVRAKLTYYVEFFQRQLLTES